MDPNETRTHPPDESADPLEIGLAAAFGASPNDGITGTHNSVESPGTIIAGKYKLLQLIGEGGMGSVWMADQVEPVKRRVAVKLIRVERGSSKTILSRFEAERQAIALMDHPHIAKLLDAGTTGESRRHTPCADREEADGTRSVAATVGQPFFVMELVKGIPLTDYCDQHKLPIPDRLHLFMQICSAVQHAHQKGIIHRDLKPSNILVESHDGKALPKVIDFGLAKATSGMQLTENTLFTGFGSVLGTPMYMAPEQANFNAIDVDTRADIYALGVILYELLTGSTPLTRETIKKAQLDEMLKLIREQEAPTPSSRLSTSDAKPTVAANRQTEPFKLGRIVKGELDWIVMKSLSKERERRYETAGGFAKDIERFLNHEPVLAGPVSAGYRLRKFVKRNKGEVLAAGLVLMALLLGMAGTLWGWQEANVRRDEADAERQQAIEAWHAVLDAQEKTAQTMIDLNRTKLDAIKKSQQAEEEKRVALAVRDFLLKDLLSQAEVSNQEGRKPYDPIDQPISVFLKRASQRIDGKFDAYPLTEAAIRYTIGETLRTTGNATMAAEHLKKSYEIRKAKRGPDHRETLESLVGWAKTLQYTSEHARSAEMLEDVLKQAEVRYPERDDLVVQTRMAVGYALCWVKEFDRAERHFRILERVLNEPPAARPYERIMPISGLLYLNRTRGKYPECERLLDQIDAIIREGDSQTKDLSFFFRNERANIYFESRQYEKAERLLLEIRTAGTSHSHRVSTYDLDMQLVHIYDATKRPEKSETVLRDLLANADATQLPVYNQRLLQQRLADHCIRRGQHKEAAELLSIVAEWSDKVYKKPDEQWYRQDCLVKLTACYDNLNMPAEADRTWKHLTDNVQLHRTPDDAKYAGWLAVRARRLFDLKQYASSERDARECLTIREKALPESWQTANARAMLGMALLKQEQLSKAGPHLRLAYRQLVERQKDIPEASRFNLLLTVDHLIEWAEKSEQSDELAHWRAERAKYGPETLPSPVEKK